MINIDTRHIKVLEDFFDDQATSDKSRIIIQSFRKAVKPLVDQAKVNAPKGKTRNLVGSIGTMELKGQLAILVGAMRPRGAHAHLNESGTVMRSYITRKKKVQKNVGKMTPSAFFERAYNATQEQIFNTTADEWYEQIGRAIDKTNRKML